MSSSQKNIRIPEATEEQATRQIREHLSNNQGRLTFQKLCIDLLAPVNGHSWPEYDKGLEIEGDLEIYHQVVWGLVSRGVLYLTTNDKANVKRILQDHFTWAPPHPMTRSHKKTDAIFYGPSFKLTSYGEMWLQHEDGIFNCLPTEYGRFSQFLSSYSGKFGDGYDARSREAVGCYKHRLYLSCCVMCGAATESIILRIRIEQTGDAEKVIADYSAKNGLEKLLDSLKHNQDGGTVAKMEGIRELIKYWRNSSAHGESNNIGEVEAFTSLLLLLRFAHFVDEHWLTLTET